jgi:hypothetical protein
LQLKKVESCYYVFDIKGGVDIKWDMFKLLCSLIDLYALNDLIICVPPSPTFIAVFPVMLSFGITLANLAWML